MPIMSKTTVSAVSSSSADHIFWFVSAWALSLGYLPLFGIALMAIIGR